MGQVVLSDSYSTNHGSTSQNLRITYSESYNASTNKTTVTVTKVEISSNKNVSGYVYGGIKINGNNVDSWSGGQYMGVYANEGYYTVPALAASPVVISHSASGTATVTFSLYNGKYSSHADIYVFGIEYDGNVYGVRTSKTASANLTTHTTTLTVNPNGGTWNGITSSQNFSQAPTSTKTIADPTRTGYTFSGWSLSGGGSISGTTYTYGSSSGTLTATWTPIAYTVTCEDRLGDSSGLLLGSSTVSYDYGTTASGADFGSDITPSVYYTGFKYSSSSSATVTGDITVYRYFSANAYSLSLTKSDNGITVNVSRTSSPYGGGGNGLLANGATVYYGDTINVSWAIASGYMEDTLTINGTDVSAETPPQTVTVNDSDLTIVMLIKLGAIVYIENDLYQAFIYDGSNWVQYEAYIYNGSSWDAY